MQTLLINKPTFIEKSRFFDANINFDNNIAPIIREVQQVDIKPQFGDVFFNKLLTYVTSHTETNEYLDKLIAGGLYTFEEETYSFEGLESAIAYYTQANMINSLSGFLTATGMRAGNDTYSSMADYKDRQKTYDTIRKVGESHMADCIVYLNRFAKETGWVACKTKERRHNFYVIGS